MEASKQIAKVFDRLIARGGSFDWNTVKQEVKADQIQVTNWLTVRNILQWFINMRMVQRTPDVGVEEYVVLGATR